MRYLRIAVVGAVLATLGGCSCGGPGPGPHPDGGVPDGGIPDGGNPDGGPALSPDGGADGGRVVPIVCSGLFRGPRDLQPGVLGFWMGKGDFNHDGKLDLILWPNGAVFYVLLGNGDGTFRSPISYPLSSSAYVGVADFDGDGNLDVATSAGLVLLGLSDGGFGPETAYSGLASNGEGLTFGDFNHDGKLDIAVAATNGAGFLLGQGDGGFTVGPPLTTGGNYFQIAGGDFNQDGWSDLAGVLSSATSVAFFQNARDGGFAAASSLPTAGGATMSYLATGDFNGDGKLDLAAGGQNVQLFLGGGDGGFAAAAALGPGSGGNRLAVGDLNRDGKDDLVGVSYNMSQADVFTSGPAGTAWTGIYPTPFNPMSALLGDFNGDGRLDLVTGGGELSVRLGLDGGSFETAEIDGGSSLATVAAADFNGDGCRDLALGGLGLWLMNGHCDGTFDPPVPVSSLYGIGLWAGDLNHDGKADLVAAGANQAQVAVFLGNGDGTFATPQLVPVSNNPQKLVPADFNRDGLTDFAVLQQQSPSAIGILLGEPDGGLRLSASYPLSNNLVDVAVADFNGDGIPDVATIDNTINRAYVMFGKGDGTLPNAVGLVSPNVPNGVAGADFTHDGMTDLVVSSLDVPYTNVYVLPGQNDGGFLPPIAYAVGDYPRQLTAADINLDGNVDLLVGNTEGNNLGVVLGQSDGGFAPPLHYRAGRAPWTPVLSDFNNDGKPDVVMVDTGSTTLSVFMQCQ